MEREGEEERSRLMEEVEVGGRTQVGDAVVPNGCWRST